MTSGIPWYGLPRSKDGALCKVWLLQAGALDLPYDLVLLADPIESDVTNDSRKESGWFTVPDLVFLIEHVPTGNHYLFDLGMQKNLEKHSTPAVVRDTLPKFRSYPSDVATILIKHGAARQQPENVKAVIFSHLHFDHVGGFGRSAFRDAELWVGPTACCAAKPGYPKDKQGTVFEDDLPQARTVEWDIPESLLDSERRQAFVKARTNGHYKSVNLRMPRGGWQGSAFEAAADIFGDGSMYIIDAPGHALGHQMLFLRVRRGFPQAEDDFVLLAGDCYHHPALLKNPQLTARRPWSRGSMHTDPEAAIDTMSRAKRCSEDDHIWVIGAHDFSVVDAVWKGREPVGTLVELNNWRESGWKGVHDR